ncbi:hypothetical protein Tco_0356377 [Tanacetum coccineum]
MASLCAHRTRLFVGPWQCSRRMCECCCATLAHLSCRFSELVYGGYLTEIGSPFVPFSPGNGICQGPQVVGLEDPVIDGPPWRSQDMPDLCHRTALFTVGMLSNRAGSIRLEGERALWHGFDYQPVLSSCTGRFHCRDGISKNRATVLAGLVPLHSSIECFGNILNRRSIADFAYGIKHQVSLGAREKYRSSSILIIMIPSFIFLCTIEPTALPTVKEKSINLSNDVSSKKVASLDLYIPDGHLNLRLPTFRANGFVCLLDIYERLASIFDASNFYQKESCGVTTHVGLSGIQLPNGVDSNHDIYPLPHKEPLLIREALFNQRLLGKTRGENDPVNDYTLDPIPYINQLPPIEGGESDQSALWHGFDYQPVLSSCTGRFHCRDRISKNRATVLAGIVPLHSSIECFGNILNRRSIADFAYGIKHQVSLGASISYLMKMIAMPKSIHIDYHDTAIYIPMYYRTHGFTGREREIYKSLERRLFHEGRVVDSSYLGDQPKLRPTFAAIEFDCLLDMDEKIFPEFARILHIPCKGVCVYTPDWPISSLQNGVDSNPDIYPPPHEEPLLIHEALFNQRPLSMTRKVKGIKSTLDPFQMVLSELKTNFMKWEIILSENSVSLTGNKDHPNACLCYMLYCLTIGKPFNLAYYITNRMLLITYESLYLKRSPNQARWKKASSFNYNSSNSKSSDSPLPSPHQRGESNPMNNYTLDPPIKEGESSEFKQTKGMFKCLGYFHSNLGRKKK